MKKTITLAVVAVILSVPAFSQLFRGHAGLTGNFTPQSTMGFNVGVSYEIPKTHDRIGYTVLEQNYKAYYIPYYAAKLGQQTRFIGGAAFVNDYSGPNRVLSQTFAVGFEYDFLKPGRDDPFNLYGGFLYTNNYVIFRVGFDMEFWSGKLIKKSKHYKSK